jgi:biopolymer transport protein ExbB/TolQ
VPALLFSLIALSAALPAAADRVGARLDAQAWLDEAVAQLRRERAAIHDRFDRKAHELSRERFASPGDRAEAWRALEDERRAAIDDADEDFEARLADGRKRLRAD